MRWTSLLEPVGRDEFRDRDAGDRRVAGKRHHRVAVAAEHKRRHILDADVQFFRDEGAEAGRVEHAGHADDALAIEARLPERGLRHGVQRIGDDDQNALGRLRHNLRDHVRHDLEVGVQQVVAAHARLARNAGGDDDDVRVSGGRVVVRAGDMHIALFNGHGFEQIERFALRHAFDNINQHHVGQFFGRNPVCCRGAHVAGADNAYFFPHLFSPLDTLVRPSGANAPLS